MKNMSEITIPETTITDEQYSYNARQLFMTVVHRAVVDYCRSASESRKAAILKELRSKYMDCVSDGMSVIVAEQLEKNCDIIRARILKEEEEE